jgi:hypothetical protein
MLCCAVCQVLPDLLAELDAMDKRERLLSLVQVGLETSQDPLCLIFI